jgi:hypothetical protein
MGSNAAGDAASAQSSAAERAAELQYQASQNALDFQKQQWNTDQQNLAPWLQGGKEGLSQLEYGMGLGPQNGANTAGMGYGSLLAANPYSKFTAPTALTEQNDPGYQARLKRSTDAIERSAAARGGLLTGGTARGLDQFSQDYASNEYGNVYNRAFNTNASNYNSYGTNGAGLPERGGGERFRDHRRGERMGWGYRQPQRWTVELLPDAAVDERRRREQFLHAVADAGLRGDSHGRL